MSVGGALLLAAVRHPALEPDRFERLVDRVSRVGAGKGPDPWEELMALATEQGVLPGLYPAVGQWAREPVRDRLRDAYATNVQRNARVSHTLQRVLQQLKVAGTEAVVLKGAALVASGAYADPGLRPMSDVDLLVPPPELRGAYDGLRRSGFTPLPDGVTESHYFRETHQAPPLVDPETGIPVELHRRLLPQSYGVPWRTRDIFYRSRVIEGSDWTGSISMRIPSTEDMVVHLALHTLSHPVFRLLGLVDLARLEAPLGRTRLAVAGLSGLIGVRGAVAAVIRVAIGSCGTGPVAARMIARDIDAAAASRAVGDCAIPGRLLRRRPHWIVDAPLARLHAEPVPSMEAWVNGGGAGAAIRLLVRTACPTPRRLRRRHGSVLPVGGRVLWPLLYPVRWCVLLWRFGFAPLIERLRFGSGSGYADPKSHD